MDFLNGKTNALQLQQQVPLGGAVYILHLGHYKCSVVGTANSHPHRAINALMLPSGGCSKCHPIWSIKGLLVEVVNSPNSVNSVGVVNSFQLPLRLPSDLDCKNAYTWHRKLFLVKCNPVGSVSALRLSQYMPSKWFY